MENHLDKTLTPGYRDVADAHASDLPGFSQCIIADDSRNDNVLIDDLETWFSEPRMARFASSNDPIGLYLWDTRLAKAYLEDVAHVEVLLRNFISDRLQQASQRAFGTSAWYEQDEYFNLTQKFIESRDEVKERLVTAGKAVSPDSMTAGFSLGTWLFMLSKSHEPTVWRALRDPNNGGMPFYPARNRKEFQDHVQVVWRLRNRCAHHEHLASAKEDEERCYLDAYSDAIIWIADKIDPRASDWIKHNSRVACIRKARP